MAEFFDMGGYGGYIWTAYGVSALVITLLVFAIWRRRKTLRARLNAAEEKHGKQ